MNTLFAVFVFLVPIFLLLKKRRWSSKKLPPGSLGIPIIGQSLSLLRNMRATTAEEWLQKRIQKYGPISKMRLFGKPTVFICGQAANKLVFASDSSTIANNQTESSKKILGDRCLLELSGQEHKRVRDALMSFLKPESLKHYVGQIDLEVRLHIDQYWHGKQEVTIIAGVWSIPINLPFTRYNRSLQASKRVQNMLKELIGEKKKQLQEMGANPRQDLITCLLSIRNLNSGEDLSEKEIVHNCLLIMTAGHDTSSVLLTFLIRLLANDPSVYKAVLQEQEEIAKSKHRGECLTWEDLTKMKYTWRVVLETMRMLPPIFGGFRKAVKDIEWDGYLIPKGWQIFWATNITQMDDGIFREPQKFDPARFENPSSIPPYCYIVFGGGHRICPGYEFAKIETLVAIHYLVTQFTWKLSSGNCFIRDPMPIPTKGLPIQITPKSQES